MGAPSDLRFQLWAPCFGILDAKDARNNPDEELPDEELPNARPFQMRGRSITDREVDNATLPEAN